MIAARIERHPVEPGRQTAFSAKRPDPVGKRHGNLLRHVLGLGAVTEEPVGDAIKCVVVALQQMPEGAAVAILGPLGQIKVADTHVFEGLDASGRSNLGAEAEIS